MRIVIQRVSEASVSIDGKEVSRVSRGFLVLLGIEVGDTKEDADFISEKIATMRVFEDENGKMNLALTDVGGEILVVSQFTLLGDMRKGRRPSFIAAARPEEAIPLYEYLVASLRGKGFRVGTGVFGADMQVALVNDGPVTMLLDSHKLF